MSIVYATYVLPVYEVGEHEGRMFVTMEFVRGKTLRAWASSEPYSSAQAQAQSASATVGSVSPEVPSGKQELKPSTKSRQAVPRSTSSIVPSSSMRYTQPSLEVEPSPQSAPGSGSPQPVVPTSL